MKQASIIKKLRSLKLIQPDSETLRATEKNVYFRIKTNQSSSIWEQVRSLSSSAFNIFKANPFGSYSLTVALLVIIVISISSGFLPNKINKTLLYAKIATAPNQYVRARIALSNAQDKINTVNVASNKISENKIKDISQSIALANTELSELKLMGEKGKYTSEQCKELYRNYHNSLENLDHYITTSSLGRGDEQSKAFLKTQISNYEKEAEQKLKLY